MARQLIVLDLNLSQQIFVDYVKKISADHETWILTKDILDVSPLRELDVTFKTISDYFQSCSPEFNNLYLETQQLIKQWASQPPLATCIHALEYDGFQLWNILEHHTTLHLFQHVLWIETLRQILLSNEWERVYLLVRSQILWNVLQLALDDVGFQGKVVHFNDLDLVDRPANLYGMGIGPYLALKRIVNTNPLLNNLNKNRKRTRLRLQTIWDRVRMLEAPMLTWFKRQCLNRALRGTIDSSAPARDHQTTALPQATSPALYLFLVRNYGTIVDTLLPISRQLRSSGRVLLLGYGKPFPSAQLFEHNIYALWWEFMPPAALLRIIKHLPHLRRVWKQLEHDPRTTSLVRYRSGSLWNILHDLMKPRAGYFYTPSFPLVQIMAWIEMFKHICTTMQPRAIIAGADDHRPVLTAIQVAHRYTIPSLYVQPSLHMYNPIVGHLYTDYGAVMDESARALHMSQQGQTIKDQFVISGLPRWDSIARIIARMKNNRMSIITEIQQMLHLQPDERLVVFATQPVGGGYLQQIINVLLRTLASDPSTRLVIKLHPQEADLIERYQSWLPDMTNGKPPLIIADINVYKLLAAADLVVMISSNIGLEAAMLDRPVLLVNLNNDPNVAPFVAQGIALGAYNEAEMEQQIDRLLNDAQTIEQLAKSRRAYFEANPQLIDGRATERVTHLLHMIAAGQHVPPRQLSQQEVV